MIREEQFFTKAQLGELSSIEFLISLGYENPKEAMEDYLKNYLTLDDGFVPFAEKYSNVYDFCLLSNDVLEWSEFLTDYHKMNSYFREKFISGEVHMRKPDKEMFLYAIERLGCDPKQCIFVDNSVSNLLVANELGIQTILFNRDDEEYDGRVVDDFEALGEILENMVVC